MTAQDGTTVESATVGLMCSGTNYDSATVELNEAQANQGCKMVNNIAGQYDLTGQRPLPAADWGSQGVFTAAVGELTMSDGSQFDVNIRVDGNGSITWQSNG
jgi:hypothetical protein